MEFNNTVSIDGKKAERLTHIELYDLIAFKGPFIVRKSTGKPLELLTYKKKG